MATARAMWLAGMLGAALLAGCTGAAPEQTDLFVGEEAGSTACVEEACDASSPHRLVVTVVDAASGTPVAAAPLVLLGYELVDEVVVTPFWVFESEGSRLGGPVATARTDGDGAAVFEVPPGEAFAVAASAPERTTEVLAGIAAGNAGSETDVTLTVYDLTRTFQVVRTLPSQGALLQDVEVDAFELPLDEDAALADRYKERLETASFAIAWENDPARLQWADLYATMGPSGEAGRWLSSDEDDTLAIGPHDESGAVTWQEMYEARPVVSDVGLTVTTRTARMDLAMALEVAHEITLTFRGSDYRIIDGAAS
ncbi:MAG: hypothetical protein ACPGQL_05750 [Thermoplasmatota archaeon]